MSDSGSLINRVMADNQGASVRTPEVGEGATVLHWTDREAATVTEVYPGGLKFRVRVDKATRTDSNGMSDAQTYAYESDPNGREYLVVKRRHPKGQFR